VFDDPDRLGPSFQQAHRGNRKGMASANIVTTFPMQSSQDSDDEFAGRTNLLLGKRRRNTLTANTVITTNSQDEPDEEVGAEESKPPLNPDKSNFIFGMHPLNPDQIVINPKYPPQFFPYLYPHLYPHLFPKLYPHYTQNYQKLLKDQKRDEKKKKEKNKRNITVVLPDGRHILMNKKEFLAYQLALAQQGYNTGSNDLKKLDKSGNIESDAQDDLDSDEFIGNNKDMAGNFDTQKLQGSTTSSPKIPKQPSNPGNDSKGLAQKASMGSTGGRGASANNPNLDIPT
jgi:hypothetical protein